MTQPPQLSPLRSPLPLPPPPSGVPGAPQDGLRRGELVDGRYQVEDRLGEGGVGWVYRAVQTKLRRRVAIKLLQQDVVGDEAMRPRFEREALTLAALSHPHVVSLTDYGLWCGRPYLVMELLQGLTVRQVLDTDGAMEPRRALRLTRHLLLALAYAHQAGVVHRDLKPANLLIQTLPGLEHLKVLDFGLVKLLPGSDLDPGVQLSRIGFTFGTPAYMSPEHAAGGPVDGRSDLYAVGVVLYEMLTGVKPFEGELQDVLRHHFQTPIPQLSFVCAELARWPQLQAFVERAMAKDRDDRFPSALAMLEALDGLLCGGVGIETASSLQSSVPGQLGAEGSVSWATRLPRLAAFRALAFRQPLRTVSIALKRVGYSVAQAVVAVARKAPRPGRGASIGPGAVQRPEPDASRDRAT